MTRTPSPTVDIELRRELFLDLAQIVTGTKSTATTLCQWYSRTYTALDDYGSSFAEPSSTTHLYGQTAAELVDNYTNHSEFEAVVTNLAATQCGDTGFAQNANLYYEFFVRAAAYGRWYYTNAGYHPDAFVSGYYLFLAMSFHPQMRATLTDALGETVPSPS